MSGTPSKKTKLHPKKILKATGAKAHGLLKPIKKINKQVIHYVVKKPYQAIGVVTVITGVVAGAVYTTMRSFFNKD